MKRILPYLSLTSIIGLIYANTFLNSFHFDDIHSILSMPWIRGLDKIPQFIFSWAQRPFLILTFNINYHISEFDVWSYHLFNILGHLFVTLLLYRLAVLSLDLKGLTGNFSYRSMPFLAALLFAVHPLNTESVTYIASRSSVLATLFYVGALVLFSETKRSNFQGSKVRWVYWTGAALSLCLGILSKEIVITFPAMALLFHFYFCSRQSFLTWFKSQLKWILPIAVVLGGSILAIYLSRGQILSATYSEYSSATYFLTQTFVIPFQYFWKMFFPFNLSIDLGHPVIGDWSVFANYAGMVLLILYIGLGLYVSRFNPWLGFGLVWMGITLSPTSSVVPLLDMAVEHRTYLPLIGFSFFASTLSCLLLEKFRKAGPSTLNSPRLAWGLMIVIIVSFSVGVIDRNRIWKDEVSLWSDAKKKAPYLIRTYNNLGEAYDKRREYRKAIAEFEMALRLDPNYFFGLNNLGNVYGKLQEYFKALEYFQKALNVKPDHPSANYNMAKAYHQIGQPQKAREYYQKAVQYNPYFEEAFFNLAYLSMELKDFKGAVSSFQSYLKLHPRNPRAWFGLGNAFSQQNLFEDALKNYQQAITLDPSYVFPYINIATIHMQQGQYDEAIATYSKILSLRPNIAGVHKNLGMLYTQYRPDKQKALKHFKESLRLEPNQPQADSIRQVVSQLEGAEK